MEPTNNAIIFMAVIAIIGIVIVVKALTTPDDTIEMNQFERRDIARREKEWNR